MGGELIATFLYRQGCMLSENLMGFEGKISTSFVYCFNLIEDRVVHLQLTSALLIYFFRDS